MKLVWLYDVLRLQHFFQVEPGLPAPAKPDDAAAGGGTAPAATTAAGAAK
jgi:hypothetical protein